VSDMRKKLNESVTDYVSREAYERISTPTIDGEIKVIKTQKHSDYLDGHEDLPLINEDD